MQYAVWIAIAVVFIAIAPALFKSAKGKSGSEADSAAETTDAASNGDGAGD